MSMVRTVVIFALLCAGALPAFAWSTVRAELEKFQPPSCVGGPIFGRRSLPICIAAADT